MQLVEELYRGAPVRDFPPEFVGIREDAVVVEGLYEKLYEAYEKACLLTELNSPLF